MCMSVDILRLLRDDAARDPQIVSFFTSRQRQYEVLPLWYGIAYYANELLFYNEAHFRPLRKIEKQLVLENIVDIHNKDQRKQSLLEYHPVSKRIITTANAQLHSQVTWQETFQEFIRTCMERYNLPSPRGKILDKVGSGFVISSLNSWGNN